MRDSFIFYRSFFEAVAYLDKEAQADCFNAICQYVLNDNEVDLEGAAKALFVSMKPQLDANNRRYQNGCKGGRKRTEEEPNDNQTETKTEPKQNQNKTKLKANENENVNVNDNENENVIIPPFIPLTGEKEPPKKKVNVVSLIEERHFSDKLRKHIENWVKYKIEKRQGYKETGFKSFLSQVENKVSEYGEEPVIAVIDKSMAANYQGIVWDWLNKKSPPTGAKDQLAAIK